MECICCVGSVLFFNNYYNTVLSRLCANDKSLPPSMDKNICRRRVLLFLCPPYKLTPTMELCNYHTTVGRVGDVELHEVGLHHVLVDLHHVLVNLPHIGGCRKAHLVLRLALHSFVRLFCSFDVAGTGSVTIVSRKWCYWHRQRYKCVTRVVCSFAAYMTMGSSVMSPIFLGRKFRKGEDRKRPGKKKNTSENWNTVSMAPRLNHRALR